MSIHASDKLGPALIEALGLPKRCIWLELRVACDETPTVKCEYYPDDETGIHPQTVLAEYEVVERTSSRQIKPISFDVWMAGRIDAGRARDADTMRRLLEMDRRVCGKYHSGGEITYGAYMNARLLDTIRQVRLQVDGML